MSICKIGVYGLGVMGRSLAVNIARHGYQTAVYNIDPKVTEEVIRQYPKLPFHGAKTLSGFLNSLEKPRCILLMITAGKAVDEVKGADKEKTMYILAVVFIVVSLVLYIVLKTSLTNIVSSYGRNMFMGL